MPFLRRTFLSSLRQAIAAARGDWNERRETAQFENQLDLAFTKLIESDGINVGFYTTQAKGNDVLIHTLCIVPEHQNKGIGTEVTRSIVAGAVANGLGVMISVLKTNPRAERMYARIGFHVIEESQHHRHMRYGESSSV